MRLGKTAHKAGIGRGRRTSEPVVEMGDGEGQIHRGGEFEEEVEEADRIGTAGDGDEHTFSLPDH